MNKIVKFVVLPLAVIVVVAVAIGAYVAATFDPNQYKAQIVQAVKDKTKRTLKLEGDIKLAFFPSIGATVGKASLSEYGNEQEFASFGDLRVSLKLMPLLSKEVIVDAIEIKNLRAKLVRGKDGKLNFDDLTGGPGKKETAPKSEGPPVKIDINHVTLENAAVNYVDHQAGTQYALSKLNLKTGRIASGVQGKYDLSFTAQSDKPKLNLDTAVKTSFMFDLDKQHYVLDGLDLSAKGAAAGVSNLAATVKGDIDAKPSTKELIVSKLAIGATGKPDGGGDLNFKFDAPKLNVTKDNVSGEKIVLDATIAEGKGKTIVKLEIPGIDGTAKSFSAASMTLNVEMQGDGATTKAKVSSPLTGSVDAERIELPKLTAAVTVANPKLPKNPIDATITGSALVDIAKENVNFTFATKFDDSNINGRAGLTKFTPPAYTFDVNIDQLDADRYLPKSDPKQKQPEQPLDLAVLKNLNASGSIKIGSLKVSNVKATNVRVDVKAANGRVDVSPIAANLYQGTLAGGLSVQSAGTPLVGMKQTMSGVNVGALLKDAANFESLEGKGNLSLDVSGQGNTVTAIKKALNGTAALKLTDGAIKGINIAGSIRDAKAKLGSLKGEKVQAASQTEKTDFSELTGTFNIKNGVAHNTDLDGKSPLLRLGGDGDIDIGNENLNYLVKATVVATAAGQGGKELGDLKGLTVPVKLTGPFAKPEYKIDFSGVAASAAKAVVEGKKEEIKSKVEGQVQDRLKGIFGR
ncbi:MAG: AsmA family protein [Betaproteobacteria bacterium]|nr:AsmA family protein [Betaproteobacteria bacterium]